MPVCRGQLATPGAVRAWQKNQKSAQIHFCRKPRGHGSCSVRELRACPVPPPASQGKGKGVGEGKGKGKGKGEGKGKGDGAARQGKGEAGQGRARQDEGKAGQGRTRARAG